MSSLFGLGGGGNVGASGSFYDYSIDQSLRFNDDDSAYLSRTPSSASNRKTFTFSAWIKVNPAATNYPPIFSADNTAPDFVIRLSNTGSLQVVVENGGGGNSLLITNRLFRDPSSWYHLVVVIDTTNSTANDRIKVYVNGVEETSFSSRTNPSLNFDTKVNSTVLHRLGLQRYGSYWDGYMAEVNFIDGTVLDPTSFGETSNGVWVPKAYSGSYGTNGFYLSFADSAAIGDDLSGNTNDWTANNLAASDVVPDSPTNNFATLNAAANFTPATLAEGNLKATPTSSSDKRYHSTFPISSGKWYCEIRIVSTGTRNHIGFWGTENTGSTSVPTNYARLGVGNGSSATSGTFNGTGFTANAGDILTYAFDADDGKLYFGRNAAPTIGATADFTGLASDTYVLGQRETGTLNTTNHFNFGQDDTFAGAITAGGNSDDNGIGTFKYAPPSGFLAMCSANLPEPAIGPNSGVDEQSDDYFNTVLYTGNGTGQSITGVGFQPDWVWLRTRSVGYQHSLYDSVRGAQYRLASDQNAAEVDNASANLQSFDSDGFTVGTLINDNQNSVTYVGWSWKAGGAAVSNTSGSITSSVSANQDAGFSIASYTGTGANATVGHGLASAPEMVIIKSRTSVVDWAVGFSDIGFDNYLKLNQVNVKTSAAAVFNSTAPTASVFSIGTNTQTNKSADNYVAYCFHSVYGYSHIGTYIGNANTDGVFVYTGFRPALILWKRIDAITTSNWYIIDAKRDPSNVAKGIIPLNTASAESSANNRFDLLSNGFKARNAANLMNGSGGEYIFYAVAEAPFKYANAR